MGHERADAVRATQHGAQRVVHRRPLAPRCGAESRGARRPGGVGDGVDQLQRTQGAAAAHLDPDRRGAADRHPRRVDPAPHPHRPPAQGREQQREQGEQRDEGADAQQVALVERDGAGRGGDPAREEAAAPRGERDPARPHSRAAYGRAGLGTGSRPSRVCTSSAVERLPACASGASSRRCASTGTASAHVIGHDERPAVQRGGRLGARAPGAAPPAGEAPAGGRAARGWPRRARRCTAAAGERGGHVVTASISRATPWRRRSPAAASRADRYGRRSASMPISALRSG